MFNKIKPDLKANSKVYLKIKVRAGANRNEVSGILEDGTIKINIAASPVKNKANKELISFLAKELELPRSKLKIIKGEKNKLKILKIS